MENPKENDMYKRILSIALKGIAVAMGAVVIVLSTLRTLTIELAVNMLAIGLFTLAIAALQKE